MKNLSFKNFLTVLALSLALFSGATSAATEADSVKVLNRAEIDALLAKPEQLVIVDLRRPDEQISIGGFPVYLSIQLADLPTKLAWIPKDRTVIAVSNHANRGKRGAAALIDAGFKVAGAAGVQDYEAEGGTLVKIQPPAPKAEGAAQ